MICKEKQQVLMIGNQNYTKSTGEEMKPILEQMLYTIKNAPEPSASKVLGYTKEDIEKHRLELQELVKFVYTDRSKINLLKYRGSDKHLILQHHVHCKKCTKQKIFWNFYNKETGECSDYCKRCNDYLEVLEVLSNIDIENIIEETEKSVRDSSVYSHELSVIKTDKSESEISEEEVLSIVKGIIDDEDLDL